MKTLHKILCGFIILTFSNANSQDLKGIWFSSHVKELRSVSERVVISENEDVTIKLDSTETDTYYEEAYILLDFIDDKNVIVKRLGDGEIKCDYKVKNNKLKVKINNHSIKGQISDNSIFLIDKISKTIIRETYFERIVDSNIIDKTGLDSKSLINTNWLVKTDTSSLNYGFDFHFLDSAFVVINQDFGDNGYTNCGDRKIDWYKNHLFLGIIDRIELEIKVYHFYDRNINALIGNTYEYNFFSNEPPTLKNIELIKKELPDSIVLKSLEKDLIGKWIAINNPIRIDTSFQDFHNIDSLLNPKYEIDFNEDKTFRLTRSGTIVKQGEKIFLEDIPIGKWDIGKTGKYILLKHNDAWTEYVTINKLESDYLEIFCEIEEIYDEKFFRNETVKMVKISASEPQK
ncbi:hypothetical protein [Carboxylicivirga caseinilyticus]|uniref:hypothetical protein n=1 Tax=Carboxylicivirga caseinilyticus TaxID=3417572 RepID=UPI003D358541|nr:hypothetical protein [Marinilabiliaceae bacterium A049]